MSAQIEQRTLEFAPAFAELLQHMHPLAAARSAITPTGKLSSVTMELWTRLVDNGWLDIWGQDSREAITPEILAFAEAAGRHTLTLPFGFSAFLLPSLRELPELASFNWKACEGRITVGRVHSGASNDQILVDFLGPDCVYFDVAISSTACHLRQVVIQSSDTVPGLDAFIPIAAVPSEGVQVVAQTSFSLDAGQSCALLKPYLLFEYGQMVGAALAALELAVSYAKERRQFGRAIGEFQAVKHQLADAWVGLDNGRYALDALMQTVDSDVKLPALIRQCDRIVSEGSLRATRLAIQVHGGVGFAWEHDVHLYLKRAYKLAAQLRPLVQQLK